MKSSIKVVQIKILPEKGQLEDNFAKMMVSLKKLTGKDVDVVVTPEGFLDGYIATEKRINKKNIRHFAIDPLDSSYVKTISGWARKNSTWVILGCCRLTPSGVYNSALVINRRGKLEGWYDKTHCQAHDRKYIPGSRIPVFKSDFGYFGVIICADRRWPETVRSLAVQGARIIFNPTCGMHDERNLHMMQTRSYESECYIAFTHPLQSLITGPKGEGCPQAECLYRNSAAFPGPAFWW
ncbi:MAG: carbon-nitrogen hydrolase family protein [Candidatus Omnitrophica bacterium]|nr:carbon-nitrogen hydrolase family protein [Candidatus Omnitrophota bacterium]